jgi:TATA-binding protein-associated factor
MTFAGLYEFQTEDVAKLSRKKHALVGSEMGVGKTHVAIALDMAWYDQRVKELRAEGKPTKGKIEPTLVVAPLNTFDSWQAKYAMQNPEADVFVIDRKNRDAFVQAIMKRRADIFIIHWDALRLMPELAKFQFNVVIADEVHHIANRKAQVTRALKKLHTNHKLGLSGTASGNRPANLWSVLNWLWPSYYSSYWNFDKFYVVREVQPQGYSKIVGVQNEDILHNEMSPWYVRHLKRERCCDKHPEGVMHWLPEKTYDSIWVDLSPKQRKVYNEMRDHMVSWVEAHEQDGQITPLLATAVVAQMVRLQQIALATPEITGKWVNKKVKNEEGVKELVQMYEEMVTLHLPSTKIDALKSFIEDADPGKQLVVFTSSKKAAYLTKQALDSNTSGGKPAPISCEVLSGDTPQAQRATMVQRFAKGGYRIFVAVIAAASEGIDGLQLATDTMLFLDRDQSAVRNKQAEDRLHRGGQKDTVQIIDIMARNTLDAGKNQKLELTWSSIKKMLGDK